MVGQQLHNVLLALQLKRDVARQSQRAAHSVADLHKQEENIAGNTLAKIPNLFPIKKSSMVLRTMEMIINNQHNHLSNARQ